jgi:hypothetical protein
MAAKERERRERERERGKEGGGGGRGGGRGGGEKRARERARETGGEGGRERDYKDTPITARPRSLTGGVGSAAQEHGGHFGGSARQVCVGAWLCQCQRRLPVSPLGRPGDLNCESVCRISSEILCASVACSIGRHSQPGVPDCRRALRGEREREREERERVRERESQRE